MVFSVKRFKVRNAIACEYVAQGAYNKHNLVNVYSGDIVVREFPTRFPLSFYVEMDLDISAPKKFELVLYEGKKKRARLSADFDYEPGKIAVFTLPPLPFNLEKPTQIRLVATGEGYADTVLIKKSVDVGLVPDA